MANAERFSIKRYTTNSGEERWKIDGRRIDGSRVRERFKTRDKAVVRKNELEVDASNQSDCVRLRKTRLTDDQLLEAEAAFLKLNGKPLFAAVDFYLDHFREPIIPIELGDAFRLFMADKHHENLRPRYLSELRSRAGFLASRSPRKLVHPLNLEDVRPAVFRRPDHKPRTTNGNIRVLAHRKRGFCLRPCSPEPATGRSGKV